MDARLNNLCDKNIRKASSRGQYANICHELIIPAELDYYSGCSLEVLPLLLTASYRMPRRVTGVFTMDAGIATDAARTADGGEERAEKGLSGA